MKLDQKWMLGLSLATGVTAAGLALLKRRKAGEEPRAAEPNALLPSWQRAELICDLEYFWPDQAVALVMSDDRGDLAHDLAPRCRMIFSAAGDGTSAMNRAAWPANIINAEADLTHLWLADDSLDAVTAVNVLQCQAEPEAALSELRRVLKPEGLLCLPMSVRPDTMTPAAWQSSMALMGLQVQSSWSEEELTAFLKEQGWEILHRTRWESGLPMVQVLCRVAV